MQLTDDRFALVDTVNSSRPLKPRVMVHDQRVPGDRVVLLDLENEPAIGIRRSLPSGQLPRAAQEVLMPPQRMSWYFEAADGDGQDEDHGHGQGETRH